MKSELGELGAAAAETATDLDRRQAVRRAWERDHTLWSKDPTEVADRLGWIFSPDQMAHEAKDLARFASDCAADGLTHVLLMGMGGSSLFPEVMARTFSGGAGDRPGAPPPLELAVLDTTDPGAIERIAGELPMEQTLFVAASKSGSTLETQSHLALFWERVGRPEQFAVITDPGSALGRLGRERKFRRVFDNRPDIGGRYSALSHFGMVPAALAGVDIAGLLDRAGRMAAACAPGIAADRQPGLWLGAVMGAAVGAGRDKLTLVLPPEVSTFGLWLEQLLAESTGKEGTGVVPIVGEPLGPPEVYGQDRLFVSLASPHGSPPAVEEALGALAAAGHPVVVLPFSDPLDLGTEVVRWEMATALAGAALGINPFDQPNVAEAKAATASVLEAGVPDVPVEPLASLLALLRSGDYLAIQAYVDPASPAVGHIETARAVLRDRYQIATTVGIGPRFLHSTGQLHKGGPPTGVFAQVLGSDEADLAIPGQPFGFSTLKAAQAAGDLSTLRGRGLRAARIALAELLEVSR
ncbi:MAG: glucose-6-phosphate isomerase [Acidimicrobiales bacterium]